MVKKPYSKVNSEVGTQTQEFGSSTSIRPPNHRIIRSDSLEKDKSSSEILQDQHYFNNGAKTLFDLFSLSLLSVTLGVCRGYMMCNIATN